MIASLIAQPRNRRAFPAVLAWGVFAIVLSGTATADATSVTFASFQQVSGNPFAFTTTATEGTLSASTAVNFKFSFDGLPTAFQAATLTMTAKTTAAATGSAFLLQTFNQPSQIKILRTSDSANLLTVDFTGGLFSGSRNGSAGGLNADVVVGDQIAYTSDFIDFNNPLFEELCSFALSFSSITPGLGKGAKFLNPFTSSARGDFVLSVVPEPSSLVLYSLGMIGLGVAGARIRRTKASA